MRIEGQGMKSAIEAEQDDFIGDYGDLEMTESWKIH